MALYERITAAARGGAGPGDAGKEGIGGQNHVQVLLGRGKFARQGEAEAELPRFLPFVLNLNFDCAGAVLAEPDDRGQLDLDSVQRAQAEDGIQGGEHGKQDDGRGGDWEQGRDKPRQQRRRQRHERGPEEQPVAGNDHGDMVN